MLDQEQRPPPQRLLRRPAEAAKVSCVHGPNMVARPPDVRYTLRRLVRREISERRRAEETLRLSERNLRRLTELIPQMLWSATPDGYVNRAVPDEELDTFVDALA